ncbi:hypothetical protein P170DRAFT_383648 [Aspergillus steynii IBT 23096]|uniref:RlpA-like protein double-psi beta-barrel domain-containing protein n=1 Tax=Aspergillus steynii IBT 23096 TaxID=1392250 RepID=A0A2I2G858_9EURO|nr:uncharacterized protein P170DRAFT_383648 [Aspergillus steynii IBT 23096]PLB49061.1 hypothetical protein P170DRAFT_383648 [Aspergillus steynii IBT 23096]
MTTPMDVPKRKPLPIAKDEEDNVNATAPPPPPPPPAGPGSSGPQWWQNGLQRWSALSQRKRTFIFIAVFGSLALIALIIGLAVGLTRRGSGHANLPLPTSHGGPYKGDLTYYDPALGSCGITSSSSDLICAVSHKLFDAASTGSNPNANPLCGLKLRVKRGESSVDVMVVDRCVGCDSTDLDVSSAAFKRLADMDLGRVLIEWAWLDKAPVDTKP